MFIVFLFSSCSKDKSKYLKFECTKESKATFKRLFPNYRFVSLSNSNYGQYLKEDFDVCSFDSCFIIVKIKNKSTDTLYFLSTGQGDIFAQHYYFDDAQASFSTNFDKSFYHSIKYRASIVKVAPLDIF